jgi:mannosyltransferase
LLPVAGPHGDLLIPVQRRGGVVDAATLGTVQPSGRAGPELAVRAGSRWLSFLAWSTPASAMFATGLVGVGAAGLWSEELATWEMTRLSWSRWWHQLPATDATPALYGAVVRVCTEIFGDSDVAMRGPSVVAMAAAVALVARAGTRVASARAGLMAGLIMAALPISTRYAQQACPYAFLVLVAAATTLFFVRMLDRPAVWGSVAYALCVAALGSLHLIGLLLLLGHGVVVLVRQPRLLRRWVLTVLAGLVLSLPVMIVDSGWSRPAPWGAPSGLDQVLDAGRPGGWLVVGAMLVLAAAGLSRERANVLSASIAIAPTVVIYAGWLVFRLWPSQFVLFVLAGWVVLAGVALARRGVAVTTVVAVATAGLCAHGLVGVRAPAAHPQDTKAVAALIARDYRPGDGIVYGVGDAGPGAVLRDVVLRYVPGDRQPTDLVIDRSAYEPIRTVDHDCPDIRACVGETKRVWVLSAGERSSALEGVDLPTTTVLELSFAVTATWHTTGLTVSLLARKE